MGGRFGGGRLNPKQVVDLADKNDQGDARRKSADDGRRDEGNEAAQPQQSNDQQGRTREQACHPDPFQPVARDQHDQHRRHGAGGTADLEGCAGEGTHNESRKDGRNQPRRGRGARGDPERQRQRQRYRGDREAGQQVLLEFGK